MSDSTKELNSTPVNTNENDGEVSGPNVCPHCNDAHLDSAGPSTGSASTSTRAPNEATDINTDEDQLEMPSMGNAVLNSSISLSSNNGAERENIISEAVQFLLDMRGSELNAMLRGTGSNGSIGSTDSGVAPLPPEKIAEISTMAVGPDDIDRDAECTICKENYRGGMAVCRLPCKHIYHVHCLEKWLHHHGTCPICRLNLNDKEKRDDTSPDSAASIASEVSESQIQSVALDENADETE